MIGQAGSYRMHMVRLSAAQREQPEPLIRTGKRAAQMLKKARIPLAANVEGPGLSDGRIVETLGTSRSSVERTRRHFVDLGLEAALARKPQKRPSREPIFDGETDIHRDRI